MNQDVFSLNDNSTPVQKTADMPFTDCFIEIIKSFQIDIKNESNQGELKKLLVHLQDINPQGAVEEMLATQMLGTHKMIMTTITFAHKMMFPEMIGNFVNALTKLSRTFTTQMEALNRHRGKGQQKMTVEHVHVNAGGQAIIGHVDTSPKKGKGGRINEKNKEQPHG